MDQLTLRRCNETEWSFQRESKELRVITPQFGDRSLDYELARKVVRHFQMHPMTGKTTWECCCLPNETVPDDLLRTWKVQDITKSYFASLQKGSIFYRKHFPHISVQVLKVSPNSFLERLWLAIKTSLIPCRSAKYQEIIVEPLSTDLPTLYLQGSDPYSKLASTVLQRDETPFVSEHLSQGTYHFALEEGNLKLVHASTSPASQHATRAALLAYRNFLKRAFEWRSTPITTAAIRAYGGVFDSSLMTRPQDQFFGYLKETFGIDFDLMLKEGTPLLPDHIYKCNIAAYHIEMPYLESLLFRLNYLMSHAPLPIIPLETIDLFYDYLQENQFDTLFSLKEIRGIYESFLKNSPERKIEKYLKPFQLPSSFHLQPNQGIVRDLMPRAFHQLMQIVMVDSGLVDASSSDKLFTGRTIPHLAISGYKTMGNRQVFDPCRNLAELLHIFPLLRTAHFKRYLELLAHVVSKKALYSVYPSSRHFYTKEWRVGKVIPFPDERGITRWYYIDGYLNDGNGDINYILLPACREYPKLGYTPLIKLYRSTASDREAESSVDSLLADVNPEKVGSLDFDQGDEYEKVYLEKPTMPVWVGYLILGQIDKAIAFFPKLKITPLDPANIGQKEENFLDFLNWQREKIDLGDGTEILTTFKKKIGAQIWNAFLNDQVKSAEWEKKNKVAEDIVFVGHSLGGALAQGAVYHFGPQDTRIPLVGHNYRCFAFDPPGGVTPREGLDFLHFGRRHKNLLIALKQKWQINYQFEYQDFVPQGGSSWLGVAKDSELDKDWLEIKGEIYEALPTAKDLEIVTMPTHGRRFLHLPSGKEHVVTPISVQELYTFKNKYWMPLNLRKKFGFHLTTPRLTDEIIRKWLGGTIGYTWLWLKKKWQKEVHKRPTDAYGVSFYSANIEV